MNELINPVTLAYDTIPPEADMPAAEFFRMFLMYLEARQRRTIFECLRFTIHREVNETVLLQEQEQEGVAEDAERAKVAAC